MYPGCPFSVRIFQMNNEWLYVEAFEPVPYAAWEKDTQGERTLKQWFAFVKNVI